MNIDAYKLIKENKDNIMLDGATIKFTKKVLNYKKYTLFLVNDVIFYIKTKIIKDNLSYGYRVATRRYKDLTLVRDLLKDELYKKYDLTQEDIVNELNNMLNLKYEPKLLNKIKR